MNDKQKGKNSETKIVQGSIDEKQPLGDVQDNTPAEKKAFSKIFWKLNNASYELNLALSFSYTYGNPEETKNSFKETKKNYDTALNLMDLLEKNKDNLTVKEAQDLSTLIGGEISTAKEKFDKASEMYEELIKSGGMTNDPKIFNKNTSKEIDVIPPDEYDRLAGLGSVRNGDKEGDVVYDSKDEFKIYGINEILASYQDDAEDIIKQLQKIDKNFENFSELNIKAQELLDQRGKIVDLLREKFGPVNISDTKRRQIINIHDRLGKALYSVKNKPDTSASLLDPDDSSVKDDDEIIEKIKLSEERRKVMMNVLESGIEFLVEAEKNEGIMVEHPNKDGANYTYEHIDDVEEYLPFLRAMYIRLEKGEDVFSADDLEKAYDALLGIMLSQRVGNRLSDLQEINLLEKDYQTIKDFDTAFDTFSILDFSDFNTPNAELAAKSLDKVFELLKSKDEKIKPEDIEDAYDDFEQSAMDYAERALFLQQREYTKEEREQILPSLLNTAKNVDQNTFRLLKALDPIYHQMHRRQLSMGNPENMKKLDALLRTVGKNTQGIMHENIVFKKDDPKEPKIVKFSPKPITDPEIVDKIEPTRLSPEKIFKMSGLLSSLDRHISNLGEKASNDLRDAQKQLSVFGEKIQKGQALDDSELEAIKGNIKLVIQEAGIGNRPDGERSASRTKADYDFVLRCQDLFDVSVIADCQDFIRPEPGDLQKKLEGLKKFRLWDKEKQVLTWDEFVFDLRNAADHLLDYMKRMRFILEEVKLDVDPKKAAARLAEYQSIVREADAVFLSLKPMLDLGEGVSEVNSVRSDINEYVVPWMDWSEGLSKSIETDDVDNKKPPVIKDKIKDNDEDFKELGNGKYKFFINRTDKIKSADVSEDFQGIFLGMNNVKVQGFIEAEDPITWGKKIRDSIIEKVELSHDHSDLLPTGIPEEFIQCNFVFSEVNNVSAESFKVFLKESDIEKLVKALNKPNTTNFKKESTNDTSEIIRRLFEKNKGKSDVPISKEDIKVEKIDKKTLTPKIEWNFTSKQEIKERAEVKRKLPQRMQDWNSILKSAQEFPSQIENIRRLEIIRRSLDIWLDKYDAFKDKGELEGEFSAVSELREKVSKAEDDCRELFADKNPDNEARKKFESIMEDARVFDLVAGLLNLDYLSEKYVQLQIDLAEEWQKEFPNDTEAGMKIQREALIKHKENASKILKKLKKLPELEIIEFSDPNAPKSVDNDISEPEDTLIDSNDDVVIIENETAEIRQPEKDEINSIKEDFDGVKEDVAGDKKIIKTNSLLGILLRTRYQRELSELKDKALEVGKTKLAKPIDNYLSKLKSELLITEDPRAFSTSKLSEQDKEMIDTANKMDSDAKDIFGGSLGDISGIQEINAIGLESDLKNWLKSYSNKSQDKEVGEVYQEMERAFMELKRFLIDQILDGAQIDNPQELEKVKKRFKDFDKYKMRALKTNARRLANKAAYIEMESIDGEVSPEMVLNFQKMIEDAEPFMSASNALKNELVKFKKLLKYLEKIQTE